VSRSVKATTTASAKASAGLAGALRAKAEGTKTRRRNNYSCLRDFVVAFNGYFAPDDCRLPNEDWLMKLILRSCEVRSWRASDLDALVKYADNQKIWLNLRDRFPHPYTRRAGRAFLRVVLGSNPETQFAIAVEGEAVGGIGFALQSDVERVSAEIGFWLGEPFWGRGITTDALVALTRHAIETHHLTRIFALPFATNLASCRVLEKAGYHLEGRLSRSAIKNGVIVDQLQYAYVHGTAD
jgi:[ribosomal protein S5]-alanine N-acetyltransferase